MLKTATAKVKNNVIGTVAGAGVTFWAAKKYMGITGTWKLVAISLLGGIAGAYASSAIKAKGTAPKKGTIKG